MSRDILIKGGRIIDPASNTDTTGDVLLSAGKVAKVGDAISANDADVIDATGLIVAPGLIDIHVHFREPGDEGEETIITLCDMCHNTMKQTNLRVKEKPDDLETLNLFMDRENDYKGTVRIIHFLEFLRDEIGFDVIKKMVKNPLTGMKIMPYYGCMLLRPREVAIDDAEEPMILQDLLTALGCEVIDNPFKIECCGSYNTIEENELVSNRARKITSLAIERGSDAIALSCPLCRFNLDVRGKEAEKLFDNYKQLPVYYYTQLLAVALGLDEKYYGFEDHAVDPILVLKKKGVFKTT